MQPGEHEESAYEGRAGRTRRELVHFSNEGVATSVAVTRVVNLGTDPQYRAPLLDGTLHAREGAEGLAIPIVVHHPAGRRVVILLPAALRHRELAERARWLGELAKDHESPVPGYAQEPVVVVGHAALAAALDAPRIEAGAAREAARREEARREEALSSREFDVAAREQRLRERAEQLLLQEDEVREKIEESESARRDLGMRETELEERLLSLVERERAVVERERAATQLERATTQLERAVVERAPAEPAAAPVGSRPPPAPIAALVSEDDVDDDIEELEELEPVATHPRADEAAIESVEEAAVSLLSPGPSEAISPPIAADSVAELVDEDDLEEEIDEDMIDAGDVTGLHRHPEAEELVDAEELLDEADEIEEIGDSEATLLGFEAQDEGPIPAAVRDRALGFTLDEGVELYVRTTEDAWSKMSEADRAELELLVQLPSEEAPASIRALAALTLLDAKRNRLAGGVIDPRVTRDRTLLEALRRRFEARVIFHDGAAILGEGRVEASRENNVARLLEVSARIAPDGLAADEPASEETIDAWLGGSLPLPSSHVLSGVALEAADGPGAVAGCIAQIEEALDPAKIEDAMVRSAVAEATIDATTARAIERAVLLGFMLPPRLLERATAAGIVADPSSLVERQLAAFKETARRADAGLSPTQLAENWERLLAAATDAELAIDSETHELAYDAIRRVRGTTPSVVPGDASDPTRVTKASVPELLLMLDHPRYRRAAAVTLAERAGAEHIDALCKAARKMPRAEVVRVVPAIARIGEEAGDGVIDGLSAKKTFVRHAFAIALGHLKLRRAVVPLLHLLREEESPAWRDIARVVGTFGNAGLRPTLRQAADGKLPDERAILALAHLANHGVEDALLELTKDREDPQGRLAVHALAERERAREWEDRVLGRMPVDEADPVQVFARRFQEELDGKAPEADLQDDA